MCNYPRKATFQIILSRKWKCPVISELRKVGQKEHLHEPDSVFDLVIFKFMVKQYGPAIPLIR